jgi:hypothetical protein
METLFFIKKEERLLTMIENIRNATIKITNWYFIL